MYTNNNSKSKKVNFNDNNEQSISFNIDDNYDDFNQNESNYENHNTGATTNKKKMTYDDILESMCMRVQNGNLCMVREDLKNEINNLKNKTCNSQNTCYVDNKSINTLNNNSYIYNKYFQKHKQHDHSDDSNIVDDINMLKQMLKCGQITPQEYNKEVLIKLIDYRNQKLHVQKIKSKKLLFSNSNINISRGNHQQPNNMNKLFRFVGPGPIP